MTTINLEYAIEVDGLSTNTLHVRRPKLKDMLNVDKDTRSDPEKEVQLLSNLCEVPMENLIELDLKDYHQLQATYQGFLS